MVAEYKPKIIDWDFCIDKFNDWTYKEPATIIDLKKWLKRELDYQNKNSNKVNNHNQYKDPYKDKNGKIGGMF